jgi:hypothetical protein
LMRAEVRYLGDSVYARVGTAGALDLELGSQEIFGRFAKLALHGSRVVLLLPAAIFGPVIFERDLPGFQCVFNS